MRTTPLGAPTRLALTSLLVTTSLLLASCGNSDDPKADPTSSTPTASASSAPGDPSASPTVASASGEVVETKAFTVHVPDGWQVDVVSKDFVITANSPHGFDVIAFKIIDKNGDQPGLPALAKDAVQFGTWPGGKDPAIVAPSELGGEAAYHLTGSGNGAVFDQVGAMHGTDAVSINFEIYGSRAKLQSIAESVLATWQWK